MTRGRCGSLLLHRDGLAPSTPCRSPGALRFTLAGSSDRCNTSTKSFGWGFEAQGLPWPFIELPSHSIQLCLRVHRQIGSLEKILPQQPVGVLIGSTLPRALRIAEVDVDVGRQRKPPMIGKLLAPVPGQGPIQLVRYRLRLLDQGGNDDLGVLVGTFANVT